MLESKTIIDIKGTGKKLRGFALRHGYSVKDIQNYLGLACPQPVYRWYKGSMLPSIDHLLRLSELYGVHMEELLVKGNEGTECVFESINRTSFEKRLIAYCVRVVA